RANAIAACARARMDADAGSLSCAAWATRTAVIRPGSPEARFRTIQSGCSASINRRAWSWAAWAIAQPEATCSSSEDRVPGAAADGLDAWPAETGFPEQVRNRAGDLLEDAGSVPGGVDVQALQGGQVAAPLADPELQLGATDLDAQHPDVAHAISSLRHPRG